MARLKPAARKQQIVQAAISIAEEGGYRRLSRRAVATRAKCAPSLVTHYFQTTENLSAVVMGEALDSRNLAIIAQGLAVGDALALGAPKELREAAAISMVQP